MDIRKINEGLEKILEGEESLGYWNSDIKVGDEVETEDGVTGKIIKRYYDFFGQLWYTIQPENGEKFNEFWGRIRLLNAVKKEKELRTKKMKYSLGKIKEIILDVYKEYDIYIREPNVIQTLRNSIKITGIEPMYSPYNLVDKAGRQKEQNYINKLVSSIDEYFKSLEIAYSIKYDLFPYDKTGTIEVFL